MTYDNFTEYPHGAWDVVLRAVYVKSVRVNEERDLFNGYLWFVAEKAIDRWLVVVFSHNVNQGTADDIFIDMQVHRTQKLCVWIGEKWDVIHPDPRVMATKQRDYMWSMREDVYRWMMDASFDEVLQRRALDEQAVYEAEGAVDPDSGQSMN